jgi:hypothetical protein
MQPLAHLIVADGRHQLSMPHMAGGYKKLLH